MGAGEGGVQGRRMKYAVTLRPKARKALLRLPNDVRGRLAAHIDVLSDDPRSGDNKALRGQLEGLRRLRVGGYRVMFVVDDEAQAVDIVALGHRGGFYD